jgi:hypothetical protein
MSPQSMSSSDVSSKKSISKSAQRIDFARRAVKKVLQISIKTQKGRKITT